MSTAIVLFITGDAFLSWIFTNAPVAGILIFIFWFAWSVRGAIGKYDHEITGLKTEMTGVKTEMENVKTRLNRVEDTLVSMDKRLTVMETKFDMLESRFDMLESRFDLLESRFGTLETKLDLLFHHLTGASFVKAGGIIHKEKGPST